MRRLADHSASTAVLDCKGGERREDVRAASLNGIDYIEVSDDQRTLSVYFLGKAPIEIGVQNVRIEGGRRVRDILVERVEVHRESRRGDDDWMEIRVDRPGDSSTYVLHLVDPKNRDRAMQGFDSRYAALDFSFKAGCPTDLDCTADPYCMPDARERPDINYLARDYSGFRQLLLDRLAVVMPAWRERHVPDLGITLVELLAYTGDYLSQFQDAVATEAYLDTARLRISVRRHARLVDYHLYEGCNARAWLAFTTNFDVAIDLDAVKFATRFEGAPVDKGPISLDELTRTTGVSYEIFEPAWPARTSPFWVRTALSEIHFYTWGDSDCCIPAGATEATLRDDWIPEDPARSPDDVILRSRVASPNSEAKRRRLDSLEVGDVLILEEVIGPQTGNPADADRSHRHAVRLIEVRRDVDRLYPIGEGEGPGTPIVHVRWRSEDALPFPLCLSTDLPAPDCGPLTDVSVARGNVILVDHGLTVVELLPPVPGADPVPVCDPCEEVEPPRKTERFEPVLENVPLTFSGKLDASGSATRMMNPDPHDSAPQIELVALTRGTDGNVVDDTLRWTARRDLLDSEPADRHFVVEIDDDGMAHLRFAASIENRPERGRLLRARYRVGNGQGGNVGVDTITLIVADIAATGGAALEVRNPLSAVGGTGAETVAEAKQFAPSAFRVRRERAVTADDYAELLERDFANEVQGAAAGLRWNGSWYEVQAGIDARDTEKAAAALVRNARGRLYRYRRIGHDIRVESARLVPLTIVMDVCVLPRDLRAPVHATLLEMFNNRRTRNGQLGFFHPDNLRYGRNVSVSELVAIAQQVPGVASLAVTRLERAGEGPNKELENAQLPLGSLEIAQVDNDPSYPDRGTITFTLRGGR
ncbi:MAG: putative baseplate assembly protein [Gemmatimonadales bacterium]